MFENLANGNATSAPMPTGIAEEIRLLVKIEYADLLGDGLDLSQQGTNDFLRHTDLGFDDIADLGITYVSPWEKEGHTEAMTMANLTEVREAITAESLRQTVTQRWSNVIEPAIASGSAAVVTALRTLADDVEVVV